MGIRRAPLGHYISYLSFVSEAHPGNLAFAPLCLQGLPVELGQG